MSEVSKRGYTLTLPATHPRLDEVHIMAALGQERVGALLFVPPVSTDKRVSEVPVSNLQSKTVHTPSPTYCHE